MRQAAGARSTAGGLDCSAADRRKHRHRGIVGYQCAVIGKRVVNGQLAPWQKVSESRKPPGQFLAQLLQRYTHGSLQGQSVGASQVASPRK